MNLNIECTAAVCVTLGALGCAYRSPADVSASSGSGSSSSENSSGLTAGGASSGQSGSLASSSAGSNIGGNSGSPGSSSNGVGSATGPSGTLGSTAASTSGSNSTVSTGSSSSTGSSGSLQGCTSDAQCQASLGGSPALFWRIRRTSGPSLSGNPRYGKSLRPSPFPSPPTNPWWVIRSASHERSKPNASHPIRCTLHEGTPSALIRLE